MKRKKLHINTSNKRIKLSFSKLIDDDMGLMDRDESSIPLKNLKEIPLFS